MKFNEVFQREAASALETSTASLSVHQQKVQRTYRAGHISGWISVIMFLLASGWLLYQATRGLLT